MADQPLQELESQFGDSRLLDRFWAKVFEREGCWLWCGTVLNGYGQFSFEGKTVKAHRHSYEALVGPIPIGLALDHLCRNRGCVNPKHLEPVTWQTNIHRGRQSKITMEIAREVRARVVAGQSNAQITADLGVTTQNIWWIAEDRAWREDPTAPRQPVWPERTCAHCDSPIVGRGRKAIYCSRAHSYAANNAKRARKQGVARG